MANESITSLSAAAICALGIVLLFASATPRWSERSAFGIPLAVLVVGITLFVDLALGGHLSGQGYGAAASEQMTLSVALVAAAGSEIEALWDRSKSQLAKLPIAAVLLLAAWFFLFPVSVSQADVWRHLQRQLFAMTLIVAAATRLWAIAKREEPNSDRAFLFFVVLFGLELFQL